MVTQSKITHFVSLRDYTSFNTIDYLSMTAKVSEEIKAELKNTLLRQDMTRLMPRLILLVVFCSMLFSSPRTCIADTSESIYIRADGSVDPSTAPISSMDNVTYAFNGNINNSIVVEKSNIIIDGNGYTLQGSGLGKAFDLSGVNNVTIKSTDISARKSGRDAHPNYGIYLYSSSFSTISGNNITDNYYAGIYLSESSNNNIIGNNITRNYHGIYLQYSLNSTMVGNNITNNGFFLPFPPIPTRTHGIELAFSSGNFLRNNVMADSDFNFGVLGGALSDFINDVDVSNSADGKPMYYWVSRRNVEVPLDAGYVALVNCTNVRIENLTLAKNMQGILLAYTNYTTIVGNHITNNWNGISLWYFSDYNDIFGNNITENDGVGILFAMCSNNTASGNNITSTNDFGIYFNESSNNNIIGNNITRNYHGIYLQYSLNSTMVGNNITNNYYGIGLLSSYNSKFHHNNFMGNIQQVHFYDSGYSNVLDDGYPSGGNYWSDYAGVDLFSGSYQNITGSDGIGDTPYIVDANNRDRYPLVNPWSNVVVSDGFDYPVGVPQSHGGTGYVTEANDGDGYYNAQDFGDWNGDYGGYHLGEDWNGEGGADTDFGDPVYAVSNGKVVYVGDAGSGWGNVIIINHTLPDGSAVQSMYAHLRYGSLLVSEGDAVMKGTRIGEIGKGYNDNEYWAHLHFEIRFPTCPNWGQSGPGYKLDLAGWTDASKFIDAHRQIHTVYADGRAFSIGTWSNSSISNVQLNPHTKTLAFNVEGSSGTSGFCNVAILKELLWCNNPEDWIVIVDTTPVSAEITQDEDYTYIYFTYSHSQEIVYITGTHIIPEFSSLLVLPLFMIAALLAIIASRRKRFKRQTGPQQ